MSLCICMFAKPLLYKELLSLVETNTGLLRHHVLDRIRPGSPMVIHFDAAADSIVWYWTVLLTRAVPVLTGPNMFNQNIEDQKLYLEHLCTTLDGPLCLTRHCLRAPFDVQTGENRIDTCLIKDITKAVVPVTTDSKTPAFQPLASNLAVLILTSGSSNTAKIVPLTYGQLLAAFNGKTRIANLQYGGRPFLSWVGIDHVANLVQCHLYAIMSCLSQIQVPAANIMADPLKLLNLVSRHGMSRTFAPNFLLVKLLRQLDSGKLAILDADLDLKYGAPDYIIKPGFGITETCAGVTNNLECPEYNQQQGLDFVSLGRCMPGARMHISRNNNLGSGTERGKLYESGERGSLEISGPIVFNSYYSNDAATSEAFTKDGWFHTGNLAWLDQRGCLYLDGRTKEVMNINAVKYLPNELELLLERAEIGGAMPTYFCCFSIRDTSMDTKVVTVLFVPSYDQDNDEARFNTQSSIVRVTGMHTRSRPRVLPLSIRDMPKSTLGKLSRRKLQAALEAGDFNSQSQANNTAIKQYREKTRQQPKTPEEAAILDIIREQLDLSAEKNNFAVNNSILSAGATSMALVAIMHRLNNKLQLSRPVSLTDLLNYPTTKALAANILGNASPTEKERHEYNPVVVIQPHKSKPPLWLIHPGVGEVLAFVILARYVTDRPIYALRAKGFNSDRGETPFDSLDEILDTYLRFIKKRQPSGPYALAGYSFGGIIAFETAKRLEAGGSEVRHCGSWNLPPRIKERMRELIWAEVVIHLFYFVKLIDEDEARRHKDIITKLEGKGHKLDTIRHLRLYSNQARWDELGLSEEYYLSHVARDRQDWVENKLMAWKSYVREDVRFHHVQGQHYTMLNSEYATSFAKTLRNVLSERGL
ncbi:hypothetical protein F5883DRAFT_607848 [Diaporthe sp. PMI_573]|nr:hypothetical protein F5883DRAFT_607848 [Diaporthaceae sp. PMI_573]